MPQIMHVDPDTFLLDSFRLGRKVYLTGFRPRHVISIWRGGTPVGLGVDAFFRSRGVEVEHTTIATQSYTNIAQQGEVIVKNLEHLVQVICPEDGLLIIDDVYETGKTIVGIVDHLRKRARANAPDQIMVAVMHDKPQKSQLSAGLPVISLYDRDPGVWIDYPHELADLVDPADPGDSRILDKDPEIHAILRSPPVAEGLLEGDGGHVYLSSRELLLDSIRLGVKVAADTTWRPDFIVALWPGGVLAGLPVHEVYRYFLKKSGLDDKGPDHISVATSPGRASTTTNIVGIQYLEDHINRTDNILIIDTTFRAGRMVNDLVIRLKEVLRRNLDHRRVRVASLYYNPEDRSTWTVTPDIRQPHYFLKKVFKEVIYPASVHKLPNPMVDLKTLNPELWEVLYGE